MDANNHPQTCATTTFSSDIDHKNSCGNNSTSSFDTPVNHTIDGLIMASVTSLDQDMRSLRLSRYTQQSANEARNWIEQTLGESLPPGDLLEALRDGVALCKLANLVLPTPGIKYKTSSMPFVQMENISHFLKACEMPPLSMPAHDRFLTVDLYEGKDPAQVVQCLSAFSRQANLANPARVRDTLGPRKAEAAQSNSYSSPSVAPSRISASLTGSSNRSQDSSNANSSAPVSSWSKRTDEGYTQPAWNIHQYGYMGGASQGNQGISFGARRQITSQPPRVPSLAEKDRIRREKAMEEDRQRQAQEEAARRQKAEAEVEEQRERELEEERFVKETRRLREEERARVEEQKRRWAEQEQSWREEEEARRKEDTTTSTASTEPNIHDEQMGIVHGSDSAETPEQARVRELEKQLEEARERERQYQAERAQRLQHTPKPDLPVRIPLSSTTQSERPASAHNDSEASWTADERESIRAQKQISRESTPLRSPFQRPPPSKPSPFSRSAQVLEPAPSEPIAVAASVEEETRPVRDTNETKPVVPNRTSIFLSNHSAPQATPPRISSSREAGDTSLEQASDRDRRLASQTQTKAGGWASKSLLEREMERERERQREWEANQEAQKSAPRDTSQGVGAGQTWDVNQYGYMGKDVDNMNRGSSVGSGINMGGRRQIIGPRPQK